MDTREYHVEFEQTATGWSAHVVELPGCIAAAATISECARLIGEAIEFHLEGMREDGELV